MAEQDNAILNSLAKGAGIAAIGMAFSKFMGYFYRAIVARWLGPEAYGQLSLGITVLSIASVISFLALGKALERYIPEYRKKNDWESIRGAVLSSLHMIVPLSLLMGALMYLGSGFIANQVFHTPELVPVIKWFSIVPLFSNVSTLLAGIAIGFKKVEYEVFVDKFVHNAVQLTATILLIYIGFDLMGAVIGWIIGVIAGTLVFIYFIEFRLGPIITRDVEPNHHRRKLMKFSAPLMFTGIIGTVLGWSDTFFIGYFMNSQAVGFYNAAFPTALLILLPHTAFNRFALPYLTEIKEESEEKLSDNFKTLTRWTFSLTFPMFIVMALFSEQVLTMLFGQTYSTAALALTILAAGYLYQTFTGHLGPLIESYSETNLILKNTVLQLIINTILNILLIPIYGILGAAIATSLTLVVMNTVLLVESYHFHKILPFDKNILKPIAAAIIPLLATYIALNLLFAIVPLWALIPAVGAFSILYLINLVLFKGILEHDRNLLVKIGRKTGQEEKMKKILDLT